MAQTVVEAKFVLHYLMERLPGAFDNEPQIYLDGEFGESSDGSQRWEHLEIARLAATELGDNVLHVRTTRRDEPGTLPDQHLLSFEVDEDLRAVRMDIHVVDPKRLRDGAADAAALAGAVTLVNAGCPVWWRQGPESVLYGSMRDVWCLTRGRDDESVLKRADWLLTEDELSILDGSREAASRARITGRLDEVPRRFIRTKQYECFIIVDHRDGVGATTINPFTLHDGGGRFVFETEEERPLEIEVILRRSMWPSRSGRNFVPLLMLWVYADGDYETPLAGAWSKDTSGRVGWEAHGVARGRCKIPEPMPF